MRLTSRRKGEGEEEETTDGRKTGCRRKKPSK